MASIGVEIIVQEAIRIAEGGLFAHSFDESAAWHRAPYYVDRILDGDKPGDIPIEQPSKVTLHVNLATARKIGLEVPRSLLLQADRVFE